MRIAVLGAGAMGMLFGGYLSSNNEVLLVEIDPSRVDKINRDGICVREKNEDRHFHPHASSCTKGFEPVDLVLVFVKAMFTEDALRANLDLIGKSTYLMTLQNGAGHEQKLLKFADEEHIIIGSTQHNSSIIGNGVVNHGGSGITSIGLLNGNSSSLCDIADNLTKCGIKCVTCDEVKKQIWTKLFTNTAASALTAVLQVPLGFLVEDEDAHSIMKKLCREAVAVANEEGSARFDEAEAIAGVEAVCRNAKDGYTSIYSDIREGRKTEVDTISGSVIAAAKRLNVPVPCHEMLVALIHALERKQEYDLETGDVIEMLQRRSSNG